MLPPQHAVLPGCCLCAFASGCTGVSQIPCPRQHRLHLVPVTCTSYQPVLPTCSPLFGQANPIWKTVTVLLPSSPLESGAGTRNSYEFLCIRSTTCRKKKMRKKKRMKPEIIFYVCIPHAKLKHGGDFQETRRAWHCRTWRQRVSARRRWAMPSR